jgi:hypothetical protein
MIRAARASPVSRADSHIWTTFQVAKNNLLLIATCRTPAHPATWSRVPVAHALNTSRAMRLSIVALVLVCACRPPGWGKEDKPDAGDEAMVDGGSGSGDSQPDSALATTCDQTFRLEGYGSASSVVLTGTFTGWAATPGAGALPFTKGLDDAWTVTHTLDAGTYQYKFIVDGSNWILDPANPFTTDDGMGHTNSVYTCAP